MGGEQLLSVHPEELTFEFELERPSYCNLKIVNNTENFVAFKVKTTSPKKYYVRPNVSVIQPCDTCIVTITLQAQNECPPDMQCKDKFLLQSTKVPSNIAIDEIPQDIFYHAGEKMIEEIKLKVVYVTPRSGNEVGSRITSASEITMRISEVHAMQRLREERDSTLQQNKLLQRELEMLKRRMNRKSEAEFSLKFLAFAGLIGLLLGFILKLTLT